MAEYVSNLGATLLSNLGSFWSGVFSDTGPLTAISDAQVEVFEQTLLDAAEALASLSRFEIPVFHKTRWKKLVRTTEEIDQTSTQFHEFGDDNVFGGALVFGQAKDIGVWRISVPDDVISIKFIHDRPIQPTVTWVEGVDFTYNSELNFIETTKDPFNSGFSVDSEGVLSIWLNDLEVDTKLVYNHFGYVLGLYANKSSEHYKTLVNTVFDAIMKAGDRLSVQTAIASIVGIPVVKSNGETVTSIEYDLEETVISTDKNRYSFPVSAIATVQVGDVVSIGDILVDTVKIYENSQIKNADISGVFVQPVFDGVQFKDFLFFDNENHSINYSQDDDGFAVVTFPISGVQSDVNKFWDEVYTRSKASGKSVAQAIRTQPGTGQPRSDQVQAVVNPFHFYTDYMIPGNSILIKLKSTDEFLLNNSSNLVFLRKISPAHVLFIFDVEVSLATELATLPLSYTASYNATTEVGATLFAELDQGSMRESYNLSTITLLPSMCYV